MSRSRKGRTDSKIRQAHVDLRQDLLIVASYSKTVAGFWVMNGWFRTLSASSNNSLLGDAVLDALDRSASDVPTPPREARPDAPILAALGIKTTRKYEQGTKSVGVKSAAGEIEIKPTENRGRDGFVEISDIVLQVPGRDPDHVGRVVREGLEQAR